MHKKHKNENRCSHCLSTSTETTRIKHKTGCTNIGPRPKRKTMIKKIFAVRDSKAEYFNPPMFFHTIGEAERAFKHTASKQDNSIGQFPQDFDLWLLGEYDDQTGKIQQHEPMHLINGALISNQNA